MRHLCQEDSPKDCPLREDLVDNTGGGLAEDILAQDGEDTAASLLADGLADGLEVGGVGGDGRGVGAVEVGDAEDVGRAALAGAVEAGAGRVDLALVNRGGSREGDSREEGGGDGEELHFEMWLFVCWLVGWELGSVK